MPGVVIIGGCGRVGLPLGIALGDSGLPTVLYDVNRDAVKLVQDGTLPFREEGADVPFQRAITEGTLTATHDASAIADADTLIVVVGTPIDEHLNPDTEAVPQALEEVAEYLRDGQLLVLRSTVYPGITRLVESLMDRLGLRIPVAFCPERIAEGHAMTELYELPQIVASRSDEGRRRAAKLFGILTDTIVELSPEEAELAKLFSNTWRYVKFAIANQLYMIANDYGLDFDRIRSGIVEEYPRASDLPRAGFAAGPCLLKDTMQLAAFNNNNFTLGHAAMMINEGLPMYVVSRIEREFELPNMTVGILGMAFKGGSDDPRSSLSYKLKRLLRFRAREVLTTDPLVTSDPDLLSLEEVIARSELLVIGAPHSEYASLRATAPVVDVWNVLGNGTMV